MQNRRKTAQTARYGIQPSNSTLLLMILASVGFIGMVVFGTLMETLLAPVRAISGSAVDSGFNSIGDIFIIPGFLISVYLFSFPAYQLYKVYRQLSDPKSYGAKARRASAKV